MNQPLDLSRTVFDLTQEYPNLIPILKELGFNEITNPALRHSVGRVMTIPKGAAHKGIPMEKVRTALQEAGFVLEGGKESAPVSAPNLTPKVSMDRSGRLEYYLRRLGAGESLEVVRRDFAKEFESVAASEIMQAEQQLLLNGTALSEVQRLCDLHSALFHGKIQEGSAPNGMEEVRMEDSVDASWRRIPGHPLQTLERENEQIQKAVQKLREAVLQGRSVKSELQWLRQLSIHYAKKGDLLYPTLDVQYGISGPAKVMWTVDDEIRQELATLEHEDAESGVWTERLQRILERVEEMVYKEQNILFPICAEHLTDEEWIAVYRDAQNYSPCFGVQGKRWELAENDSAQRLCVLDQEEIRLPGGRLTLEQLRAILNTLPMELTFVDDQNINRFFNEGEKQFARPTLALDRDVFSCHPPRLEPMVRSILDQLRSGAKDSVPIWMNKGGHTILVTYFAVRDPKGQYLGTMELVQDLEFAREQFGALG